jgi:predicted TIM-barrel fold metal-dependent hydrolase
MTCASAVLEEVAMIIDAHAHLWVKGYRPHWNEEGMLRRRARVLGKTIEELGPDATARMWSANGDDLIEEMDDAGIDLAVTLRVDYGVVLPGADNDSPVPLAEQHRRHAEWVADHPGRLLLGAGVDPRRPNACDFVRWAVQDLGARILKLYPPAGFYPNDRNVYPLYNVAVELGIPVVYHTGPVAIGPMRSKYAHPLYLEDVAIDFPDLRILAGHCGGPWWRDLLAIARNQPNIYVDTAEWQEDLQQPLAFYGKLREVLNTLGAERVLFASDWHAPRPQFSLTSYVRAFREIPADVRAAGMTFTEVEQAAVLGENALRFFDLSASHIGRAPTGAHH